MKFSITTESTVNSDGIRLYRIKAEEDNERYNVTKDDKGGWVACKANLDQNGQAWIADNAQVFGGARIANDSIVCENAIVKDYALVSIEACVSGNAVIKGSAVVTGHANITGNAVMDGKSSALGFAVAEENAAITDNARIEGRAYISGNARIIHNSVVGDSAAAYGKTIIAGYSNVLGNARVCGNSKIRNCEVCDDALVGGNCILYRLKVSGTEVITETPVKAPAWKRFYDYANLSPEEKSFCAEQKNSEKVRKVKDSINRPFSETVKKIFIASVEITTPVLALVAIIFLMRSFI